MMNFKQWQVINETYGHFNLGIKSPRSVGTVGSKLAEMGLKSDDMADDLSGLPMDDLGGLDGLDGLDSPDVVAFKGNSDSGKIKLDDLHPSLIQLLGLQRNNNVVPSDDPFGDGDKNDFGGEPDGDADDSFFGGSSNPFGDMNDEEGEEDEGNEEEDEDESNPFGGKSSNPFGGKSSNPFSSSDDDTDDDGESDDTDDDDDNDGVEDESDSDPKDSSKKSKKHMGKCCDKTSYSKKYMGKNCLKPTSVEEQSFFNSVINMGRGDVRKIAQKNFFDQGAEVEVGPGEVGYAPTGRINTFPSVTEWTKNRAKKGKR